MTMTHVRKLITALRPPALVIYNSARFAFLLIELCHNGMKSFLKKHALFLRFDPCNQTGCLESLYKIASKGLNVEILQILFLKPTLLFYLLLRAFVYILPMYLLDCFQIY